MSQILHIFRKDARQHWPEILVSLALLTTYVSQQPHKWTALPYSIRLLEGLVNNLPEIMILTWAFLIVRLVQGESLVGDRQFWITRPYEWHKLLAAKLLSILVFIHAPFFVSQVVLLKLAQFPVLSSIPGLLFTHMLFFLALVVPSLTVGTLTRGIGQSALVVLGAFLALLGFASVLFLRLKMDIAADSTDWLLEPISLSACASVIVLQYLYRRTGLAWLITSGAIVLIAFIMFLAPYERIISGWFPLPGKASPIPAHFQLDPTVSFAHPKQQPLMWYEKDIALEFPLKISDLDQGSLIDVRAIKLDLDLPDGKPWTSNWHAVYNRTISFGRTRVWPDIEIEKSVFASLKDSLTKAHVTLGLSVYRMGTARQIVVSENRVSLPGGARCLNVLSENVMHCFSALQESGPIFIVAELPNSDCPVTSDASRDPWAASPAFFESLGYSSTPDLAFTPIQQFDLSLSRYSYYEEFQSNLPVCTGTRLVTNKPEFLYSVREEIDLGEITLANYHPTYPRKIVPPAKRPTPSTPSDTLSLNFVPEPTSQSRRQALGLGQAKAQ